jgi:hypothetical protein
MAGWGELAQPVPDHVLSDVNGNMPAAVMNGNSMSNHLGEDGARPAPGADNLLLTSAVHSLNFFQQFRFDKRTFF